MINQMDLEKKTYEILVSEAQNLVRLYTKEWNDFQPSDPGLTILENLTAFEILQQSEINEMTVEIQKKLLALVGIVPNKNRASNVLVKKMSDGPHIHLCKNQKFFVDDLCFETADTTECGQGRLSKVLNKEGDTYIDISSSLNSEIPNKIYIWGEEAKVGEELVLIFGSLPLHAGKVHIQIHTEEDSSRNLCTSEDQELFAKIKWELQNGDVRIPLTVRDETYQFLQEGTICISLPDVEIKKSEVSGYEGYVIYATLMQGNYDKSPEIIGITSGLFEMKQQHTHAAIMMEDGRRKDATYDVEQELLETGYLSVFVKETRDQVGYYKYNMRLEDEEMIMGRYYQKQHNSYGNVCVDFANAESGYGPVDQESSVLFATLSEEMMRHRNLGRVYGYDNQRIDLTPYDQIIEDDFLVLAELEIAQADEDKPKVIYDVFGIKTLKKDGIVYRYDTENHELVIEDAGSWEGCKLYIGNCVTTKGSAGNVLSGNTFRTKNSDEENFVNPFVGVGGTSQEEIEDMKERFVKDIRKVHTLVTKEDYEEVIQNISGLSIERSYAYQDNETTHIVVKPVHGGKLAQLSPVYRDKINQVLENHRLLSANVVLDKIEYIPLVVTCTLYTSNHEAETRRQVEHEIKKYIEEELMKRGFGTPIIYSEIYQYIQRIASVDSVYDLSIVPLINRSVNMQGADIYPSENGLCYLKQIKLVLHETDFI